MSDPLERAGRRSPVRGGAGDLSRRQAAAAGARLRHRHRAAAGQRATRRRRRRQRRRRAADRRDQIVDRRLSRRPEVARIPRALRPALFRRRRRHAARHHARRGGPDRRRFAYGGEILREPAPRSIAPAARRAVLLRFAIAAADRLHRLADPGAAPETLKACGARRFGEHGAGLAWGLRPRSGEWALAGAVRFIGAAGRAG